MMDDLESFFFFFFFSGGGGRLEQMKTVPRTPENPTEIVYSRKSSLPSLATFRREFPGCRFCLQSDSSLVTDQIHRTHHRATYGVDMMQLKLVVYECF